MVTIQFTLDKGKISAAGYNVTNVEQYLRNFYSKKNAIEIQPLTFQRDDENAMADLGRIITIMKDNPKFLSLFKTCVWNIDGEEEDIIEEIKSYIADYGH